MKRFAFRRLLLLALVLLTGLIYGQTTTVDLSTQVAVDPNVRIGKLDNGLVYYIRKNSKPENRVELRLAINAGSVLETDDQQGLAHFMEHMNFNGTKTFPKNELIDFLQKTGVKFGADINAYTGFDETVYMLQLPTDDSILVEKGFQVIEDWAHNALLDDKEIDKERGIIVEEWRLGLGAEDRMMKKYLPVLLKDSKYAERLPIGKVDVIENFKHESLKSFYRDWYRPNLMAVVVVGDLDPALMEARVKAHFTGLTNPANMKERINFNIPDNKDPLIAITTDKEATNNSITLFYKHPYKPVKTLADLRESFMAELYTGMMNQRLGEIAQKPEAPFVYGYCYYGHFLSRDKDAYICSSMAKENQIEKSLETLLAENERVKRFGFTQTEFDRQKEEMLSKYEKAAKEFDKTESMELTNEYVSNFLMGDPIPGAQKLFKYLRNLMPEILLDEVNALARAYMTDDNLALVVTAPEKADVKVPATADILKVINDSKTKELSAYVDTYKEEPLINGELKEALILSRKENKDLGYTELTLRNGVQVILKPTTFKNDEILISGYSTGGSSLYPDSLVMSAMFAAEVIEQSGAGKFNNIDLEKKLKGKNLEIAPYIDDCKEGLKGNSAPKDLEPLMQLVYLYFKEPRKDTSAFQAHLSNMENQVKFMKENPIMTFYDTLFKSAYPNYKRLIIIPTVEQLKQVRLDELYKIYCERFADASDFKFILVGSFSTDSIIPLVTKYFGNLPTINRYETWKDNSAKFVDGVKEVTVYKGTDPQGMIGIIFSEEMEWNPKTVLEMTMLKEILSIKLIEVIREKLSGVYSPQVILRQEHYPKPTFQLIVLFGCSPKSADKLTKAVLTEIGKFRKKGPTEIDLQKAKETLIRTRETDLEKNDFWLSKIESVYYDKSDPALILNFKNRVEAVTTGDLKSQAAKYLKGDHYLRVKLLPQTDAKK